jgi:hypothetical protein
MRETCEFRIDERKARRFLDPEEGDLLGGDVRKLVVETSDPSFAKVGRIHRELREREDTNFFSSWGIRRKYTQAEMEAAELFSLRIRATVEPEGERCGTQYDDSAGCPHCGVGARQLNELRLESNRLPRGKELARTIADCEVLFSARLVEAFQKHGLVGARFLPVLNKGGKSTLSAWYQLEVSSRPLEVLEPTRFGINPFDLDEAGEYRCPLGHVAGLNLLSELWVKRESYDGSDICATRQHVGMRSRQGGVFRPYPLLLISPRLRRLLGEMRAKGCEWEVAHLV